MVRALLAMLRVSLGRLGHCRGQRPDSAWFVVVLVLTVISGCAIVPRSRMDECQKLTQSLRADNARLKDRLLAVQGQNRDYAERAVDDAHRLAIQDEAIERLEHSVQAYQDERTRLEAAYKQLVANLGADGLGDDGRSEGGSHTARGQGRASPAAAQTAKSPAGTDLDAPR